MAANPHPQARRARIPQSDTGIPYDLPETGAPPFLQSAFFSVLFPPGPPSPHPLRVLSSASGHRRRFNSAALTRSARAIDEQRLGAPGAAVTEEFVPLVEAGLGQSGI
jgi:hypothetical protein